MRIVLQRVQSAHVSVDGLTVGAIGTGLVVFLGVTHADNREDADYLAEKTRHLRIFPDEAGRMNRSIVEAGGALLVVSQFTLYGDCRKGRHDDEQNLHIHNSRPRLAAQRRATLRAAFSSGLLRPRP